MLDSRRRLVLQQNLTETPPPPSAGAEPHMHMHVHIKRFACRAQDSSQSVLITACACDARTPGTTLVSPEAEGRGKKQLILAPAWDLGLSLGGPRDSARAPVIAGLASVGSLKEH